MTGHEQLTELLVRWQEELDEGRDVAATELCGNDSDLLPELERRIADLRGLRRLAVEIGQSIAENGDLSGPGRSLPGTPDSTIHSPGTDAHHAPSSLPRLPGYEVLQELGRGGMGIVYKARDLTLKRIVALKMLRYGERSYSDERARFRAEAEAIARLQHPHIVQVFQAGEWQAGHGGPPMPFFAMEYVAGDSLAKLARAGPLPPADVARLLMLLARAVHAAHQAGVVHRDLKPGNVLLAPPADEPALNTPWGCPKVTDFGLARLGESAMSGTGGQTVSGALLGTPAYMAPEQAEGRTKDIGPATDVWALGVILYELLTGQRPFKGDSSMITLQKVCAEEPAPLRNLRPEVPEALAAVVQRCLRKQSAERYPSAAALGEDLNRWLADETKEWVPTPAPKSRRRRPMVLRASLAAVVLLAVLSGLALWLINQPRDTGPIETPVTVPVAQPPFKGWIDILVSDPKNERRRGLRLHEPGARPLRPGDEVRVEVALKHRPGYVYVLWIDAKGKVIPIHPWQDFEWGKRPASEKPVSGTLVLPEGGAVYPIEPSPEGVETVMMLVSETRLRADEDLLGLVGDLGDQITTDREYVRWFENGQVVTTEPDRSPGGKAEASDPAERTQARIRQRLGERFAFSRAVSFFNLGVAATKEPTAEEWRRLEKEAAELDEAVSTLSQAARFPEATEKARRLVEVRRQMYPKGRYPAGHPHLAKSLADLGALLHIQGDAATAEPFFSEALEMRQTLFSRSGRLWR
jgi:serine/threonine protein kinase